MGVERGKCDLREQKTKDVARSHSLGDASTTNFHLCISLLTCSDYTHTHTQISMILNHIQATSLTNSLWHFFPNTILAFIVRSTFPVLLKRKGRLDLRSQNTNKRK